MILVLLIFLSSLGCLVVSLLVLAIVLRYTSLKGESEKSSSPNEAILITGCDSGIGLELAKYFHRTTDYTIICGLLDAVRSDGYEELKGFTKADRFILTQLDITSDQDVQDLVKLIDDLKSKRRIKEVSALINNAGVLTYGEFDWLTWNHIDSQVNVNFVGTLRLTRALIPYIIQSAGRIINVSSVNDTTVFPGLSVYSATKSALSTFSRGLGYELRKFGAHVITIRLGDFARLTNIMSSHSKHRDAMWTEMDTNKRGLYKEFFHKFNDHLMDNYGMTSPRKFGDSTLYLDFRRALLAKNPPTTITCAPITFKIFYFVIELIPVWMQYYLLDLLFEFSFRWKAPRLVVQENGELVKDLIPNSGKQSDQCDKETTSL